METALAAILKGDSDLTELLAGQIYPDAAPAGVAEPYLVYEEQSDQEVMHLRGGSGLGNCEWFLNIYAPTKLAAKAIARRVKAIFRSWRVTDVAGYRVSYAAVTDGRSDKETPVDGSDNWDRVHTLTLNACYSEL